MFFIIKPIIEGLFDNVEGKAFSVDKSTFEHIRWIGRDGELPSRLLSTNIQDRLLDMLVEHNEFEGCPIKLVMYCFSRWHERLVLDVKRNIYIK